MQTFETRELSTPLNDQALDQLFRQARTHSGWLPAPVEDDLLKRLYDLAKWGPTSANMSPMRLVFVKSKEAKEQLTPALIPGNVDRTMAAPVTVIVAEDSRFYEHLPRLFPQMPQFANMFKGPENEVLAKVNALRNSSLQGGYLILAARSLGLDAGPMSGFDSAKLDAAFFPDGRYRSNFLLNLGYGDRSKLYPRNPRFSFDEVCRIV
jgi:3-hydroxypropanoate dehydrogenase